MARKPGFHYGLALLILLVLTIACSGGGNPVMPDGELGITGQKSVEDPSNRMLWGYWTITIDPNSGNVEVLPVRGAMMHVNAVVWMQPPGGSIANLGIEVTYQDDYMATGRIDLNVSLTHPFPGADLYTGFDVLGVFITDGHYDLLSQPAVTVSDGVLLYNEQDIAIDPALLTDAVLLNPDGYTRWWNQDEFDEPDMKIFSYIPGALGRGALGLDAVINPYKYFAEGITRLDNVDEYLEANMGARGMFPAGAEIVRDYKLQFPKPGVSPELRYDYAVVANWEVSDPNPPVFIPEDFPLAANAYEPIAISVADNSTLFYDDVSSTYGGQVDWYVELYDWQGMGTGAGIDEIIDRVVVEFMASDQVPGGQYYDSGMYTWDVQPGKANSSVYHVEIPDLVPSAIGYTPAMLIFETNDDYDQGFPTEFPNGALSSYFMKELRIYGAQGTPTCEDPVPAYTDRHYIEVEDFTALIDAPGGTLYNIDWSVVPSGDARAWNNTDTEEITVNWYNATSAGTNLGSYEVCVSVYSSEGWNMCCTDVVVDDIPDFGPQTGMLNHILPNQPDQGTQPGDIAIHHAGTASIAEVMYQALGTPPNTNVLLYKFNDDYSANIGTVTLDTGYDWASPDPSWLDETHFADFHKFDVTNANGNNIHLTSGSDAWPTIIDPAGRNVNDPFHSYVLPFNNVLGDLFYFSIFGDAGSSGNPDPDAMTEKWKHMVDWTFGVTAGPSSPFYGLYTLSEEWLPNHGSDEHPGPIWLAYSTSPYTDAGNDLMGFGLSGLSIQYPPLNGPVDDRDPNAMALAVDNATGWTVDWQPGPGELMSDIVLFYMLSSEPTPTDRKVHIIWMPEDTSIGFFIHDDFIGNGSSWGVNFGGAAPIDVEVMYSAGPDNQVDHTFNYLAVLADTGTEWAVGIYRYDPIWPRLDLVTQYVAEFPSQPTAMDVDTRANEIHVLHETGGTYNVTVLQFTP